MKIFSKLCLMTVLSFVVTPVFSAVIFFDDFESDLSLWTGRTGSSGISSGQIVVDPLSDTNQVLSFNSVRTGGDILSLQAFSLVAGQTYQVSFDYLGLAQPGSALGNFGGFAGVTADLSASNSTSSWYYGTSTGSDANDVLIDDGAWRNYTYEFTAPFVFNTVNSSNTIHLMFEDATGVAGDVYFDNITLQTVPLPAAVYLFVSGLLGVGIFSFKRTS